ncbi:MAG TPA: ABC transporter permease [Symbiobacteriaceae bacterium]|jgi:peptide/nickel transport system permease protein/oligopeptide transport system permease protein
MEPEAGAAEYSEDMELQGTTFLREVWQSFKRNRLALAGVAIVLVLILVAVFAPWVAPKDPFKVNLADQFLAPGKKYWLGTDMYGRDVLSRIIYGARISLMIGLVPTLLSTGIGTVLGVVAGYFGGRTDGFIMRLADVVLAFPSLLLAMVVMYTLGASLYNIFIALSIVGWAGTSRVVRAQTLSFKEREFVEAARAAGVKHWVIMARHIVPNCLPQILILITLGIPGAIMSEASLSFLGVGAQPPAASWGLMVSNGREYFLTASWNSVYPGFAILLTVLGFNFLGDGLRDALDPYLKRQ